MPYNKSYYQRNRKKILARQSARAKAKTAAKKAAASSQPGVQRFPLDIIPPRKKTVHVKRSAPAATVAPRLQLAMGIVQLLREVLKDD